MKKAKRLTLLILAAVLLVSVFALTACKQPATITFVGGDGATGTAPQTVETNVGATITLPANTFAKDGYDFNGWSDGTSTYQAGATYTVAATAVTFTAQWKAKTTAPTTYKVTYKAGAHGTGSDVVLNNLSSVTLASPQFTVANFWFFSHWAEEGKETERVYNIGEQITLQSDMVFVAQWTQEFSVSDNDDTCIISIDFATKTGKLYVGEDETGVEFTFTIEGEEIVIALDGTGFPGTYADGQLSLGLMYNDEIYIFGDFKIPEEEPAITDEVNAIIMHSGELPNGKATEGMMILYADGTGFVYVYIAENEIPIISYDAITYTISEDGTFTITRASGAEGNASKIVTPAVGTIEGNTVSITIENGTSVPGTTNSFTFESEIYKLTLEYGYEIEDDTFSAEQYLPVGYQMDLTEGIDRDGYTLTGFEANGESKNLNYGKLFSMPSKDVTVTYVWQKNQAVSYKVTYKAGEGIGEDYEVTTSSASYKLIYNTTTNFTREGYSFAGWSVDGKEYNTGATITLTGDTVVTARWRKSYTVTFAGLDETGVSKCANFDTIYPETARYNEVSKLTLPQGAAAMFVGYVTRSGFTLTGWLSSADNQVYAPGQQVAITQNTTFTAVWELKHVASATEFEGSWMSDKGLVIEGTASITINRIVITNDQVSGDISGTITVNNGVATMTNAAITYTFILSDEETMIVSAKILNTTYTGEFAKFTPTDKTLADFQGHWIGSLALRNNPCTHIEITGTTVKIYTQDTTWSIPLTEDTTGLKLIATGLGGNSLNPITVTLTFTEDNQFTILYVNNSTNATLNETKEGSFTKAATYNVTFSLGEGVTGVVPTAQQIIEGVGSQKANKPADPEREGWTFLGWFDGEATTAFDFTANVTASVALTARWEQITEVTVTFELNNEYATGLTAPAAQTVDYDGVATAPEALELTGWAFGGWATSANSKTAFDFTTTFKKNTTLYAIWSKVYTVTYSINGETETKQNVTSNATDLFYNLTEGFPTGYEMFLGWKTDIVGDKVIHYSGESEFIKADLNEITLTAVFGSLYSKLVNGMPSSTTGYVVRNDASQFASKNEVNSAGVWTTFTVVNEYGETYWEYTEYTGTTARLRITGNTYETPDNMLTYSAVTNDETATLTFDGFGHAKLDGHTLSYIYEVEYYRFYYLTLIVSEDVKYEKIEFEFDYSDNTISFDARITIEGTAYLFGNAPEEWTVTFELGEGVTGTTPDAITVLSNNAKITLPDGTGLTNEDATLEFKGWTIKGSDGTTVLKGSYTVTGSITLVSVWGEASGASLTLADFIGTSSATAVNYGYSSLDEAGTNKLDVTNSGGTLYDLFKIQFYSNYSGNVTGNRYHSTNKSASITLYTSQDTSSAKASTTSSADDTYYISVSGIWCSIVFEKNAESVRSIKVTNLSTNVTVTWTEIV